MTLKKIGKGTFTTAYLMDDKKTVLLKSTCPIKECMACGWYPDSYLFPEVNPTNKYNEYTMAYYPRVSSLKNTLSARQGSGRVELDQRPDLYPFPTRGL